MNKLILLSTLFLAISITSCKKKCDDPNSINFDKEADCMYVDTVQRGLIIKATGTWCAPCGSYGARTMKSNLSKYPNLIGMEIHSRDVMRSSISDEMLKHFKNTAYPSFYINGKNKRLDVALNHPYELGLHINWSSTADNMNLETVVQAKEDLNGEYNIAVYLMEDGYVSPQKAKDNSAHPDWNFTNGSYPKYIHDNILRGEASQNLFGTLIASDGMSKDEVIKSNNTITIDFNPQGKVYPIAVVWKKEGTSYNLVNIISGKDN